MPEKFFLIQPMVVLTIVAMTIGLIIYYLNSRRSERKMMIEKGMNPYGGYDIKEVNKLSNLKNGILLISLGAGLLIAHLLTIYNHSLDRYIIYLTLVLISGGLGFIISYFLIRNLKS